MAVICVDYCSYQKFTKGKDLSGYHSTDLNCIFGERQTETRTERRKTDEVKWLKFLHRSMVIIVSCYKPLRPFCFLFLRCNNLFLRQLCIINWPSTMLWNFCSIYARFTCVIRGHPFMTSTEMGEREFSQKLMHVDKGGENAEIRPIKQNYQ